MFCCCNIKSASRQARQYIPLLDVFLLWKKKSERDFFLFPPSYCLLVSSPSASVIGSLRDSWRSDGRMPLMNCGEMVKGWDSNSRSDGESHLLQELAECVLFLTRRAVSTSSSSIEKIFPFAACLSGWRWTESLESLFSLVLHKTERKKKLELASTQGPAAYNCDAALADNAESIWIKWSLQAGGDWKVCAAWLRRLSLTHTSLLITSSAGTTVPSRHSSSHTRIHTRTNHCGRLRMECLQWRFRSCRFGCTVVNSPGPKPPPATHKHSAGCHSLFTSLFIIFSLFMKKC